MNQDLVVTFGKSNGKEHNWTYKGLNPNLSTPEIKEACELLTTLDIFEQDGVKLFDSVVTAKFVSTKVTTLFDLKNEIDVDQTEPFYEATCEEVGCLVDRLTGAATVAGCATGSFVSNDNCVLLNGTIATGSWSCMYSDSD